MLSKEWEQWIDSARDDLERKEKLRVPSWLPHPAYAGFVQESLSTPEGQCRDWVLPLDDQSRIHVHEFEDGRLVAHRDRYDPNQGPVNAVAHFVTETDLGRAAVIVALFVGGAKLLGSGAAQ